MTRARWLTGALIGAAALIVATQALVTYVAERLVVGAVAVVVLMAVTAIGFASLGRARRYIARELAALGAEPPSVRCTAHDARSWSCCGSAVSHPTSICWRTPRRLLKRSVGTPDATWSRRPCSSGWWERSAA